jgi:hypothetical protein
MFVVQLRHSVVRHNVYTKVLRVGESWDLVRDWGSQLLVCPSAAVLPWKHRLIADYMLRCTADNLTLVKVP